MTMLSIPRKKLVALSFSAVCFCSLLVDCSSPRNDSKLVTAWQAKRNQRFLEIGAYLAEHEQGLVGFRNSSVSTSGIPFLVYRVFDELFPDIWNEKNLKAAGLIALKPSEIENPYEIESFYNMNAPLDRGFGISLSDGDVRRVNFSCGSCHIGRVEVGSKIMPLIGAPSQQIDVELINQLFAQISEHPNFKPEIIRKAIVTKIPAWFDGLDKKKELTPAEIRTLARTKGEIADFSVEEFPNRGRMIVDQMIHNFKLNGDFYHMFEKTDGVAPYRTPGRMSTGLALAGAWVKEDGLAFFPAASIRSDIPSVWKLSERSQFFWDGSLQNSSLSAALVDSIGVAGSRDDVDFVNASAADQFASSLPSPPYPFDIDEARAERGAKLYQANCQSCHESKTNAKTITVAADVGTEPARANAGLGATKKLQEALLEICTDNSGDDCETVSQVNPTRGYKAESLAGVWASAPYLHNGSVPSLYHLLVPEERPGIFCRGNLSYDEVHVGFSWRLNDDGYCDSDNLSNATTFDARIRFQSNKGHDSVKFLGKDWRTDREDLLDLLEYLKSI